MKRQKGFTLIELLVVIAILGILVAIVVPAVAHFIGTGTTDAANTEARNVELAVTAYMAEYTLSDFDGDIGPGTELGPEVYLSHPSNLQAVYTIEDGVVVDAEKIDGSKWGDLEYNPATGWS